MKTFLNEFVAYEELSKLINNRHACVEPSISVSLRTLGYIRVCLVLIYLHPPLPSFPSDPPDNRFTNSSSIDRLVWSPLSWQGLACSFALLSKVLVRVRSFRAEPLHPLIKTLRFCILTHLHVLSICINLKSLLFCSDLSIPSTFLVNFLLTFIPLYSSHDVFQYKMLSTR